MLQQKAAIEELRQLKLERKSETEHTHHYVGIMPSALVNIQQVHLDKILCSQTRLALHKHGERGVNRIIGRYTKFRNEAQKKLEKLLRKHDDMKTFEYLLLTELKKALRSFKKQFPKFER